MGQKGIETRRGLLAATRSVLESRGYFGTGLNQILEESGAPRGSLYYHFPAGKDQLVTEAITHAGADITALIESVEADDARGYLRKLLELLGGRLEASGWTAGCPVAGVALDASSSNEAVQQACSAAYQQWETALCGRLAAFGHPEPERLATAALALIEGGLILGRTHRSQAPLRRLADTIDTMV